MKLDWDRKKDEENQKKVPPRLPMATIAEAILNGGAVAEDPNPNYPGQTILVVIIEGYTYAVPCEKRGDTTWLITNYPSRKLKARYGGEK